MKNNKPDSIVRLLNSGSRLIPTNNKLGKLATSTKLFERKPKKITAPILLSALLAALAFSEKSCRAIALSVGVVGDTTISRVAIWRFLGKPTMVVFLERLIAHVIKEAYKASDQAILNIGRNSKEVLEGVNRIIIGDATSICLHPSLHWAFPGSVNQTDVKKAHLKIQLAVDLLTGKFIDFSLDAYQRSDMKAAFDIIAKLVKGDLLIRDLGYNKMEVFQQIIAKEAFFLSRLMLKHNVLDVDGNKIDLVNKLRQLAPQCGRTIRLKIKMTESHNVLCDLIAIRVPQEVANLRRSRLKQKHADRGWAKPSDEYLALQDWTILVTNLPEESADNEKVRELYMMRWRIEMIFKACKSHTGLLKIAQHKTNPNHAKALILGWLLLMAILAQKGAFGMARLREVESPETHECYDGLEVHNHSLFKSLTKRVLLVGFQIELASCGMSFDEHWQRTSHYEQIHNLTDLYPSRLSQSECLSLVLEVEKIGSLC